MRFNIAAMLLAALAGSAIAAPKPSKLLTQDLRTKSANCVVAGIESRSLVTEIGSAIADLEEGLGVTALEEKLDALLGGALTKVCQFVEQRSSSSIIDSEVSICPLLLLLSESRMLSSTSPTNHSTARRQAWCHLRRVSPQTHGRRSQAR